MRALWNQRGGKPGEYIVQTGRGKDRQELAKLEGVTFELPEPGSVLTWDALDKAKRTVVDENGNKVRYEGAEAVVIDWYRSKLASTSGPTGTHRELVQNGEKLTAKRVSKDLDAFDPFAPRTRKSTADSISELAAKAGIADSADVQKLLKMLAEK